MMQSRYYVENDMIALNLTESQEFNRVWTAVSTLLGLVSTV